MDKQTIFLTVSAYGAMSDSTSRYRAVIVANNPDELNGKLHDFFVNEINRAKNIEDLSDSDITEIVIPDKIKIPQPEEHEIIAIPELATDYHIEDPVSEVINGDVDENHMCRNAYVFTAYKRGFCCEESEFPNAMAVCFIDDMSVDDYKGLCDEVMEHMAWDCHKVPVL